MHHESWRGGKEVANGGKQDMGVSCYKDPLRIFFYKEIKFIKKCKGRNPSTQEVYKKEHPIRPRTRKKSTNICIVRRKKWR